MSATVDIQTETAIGILTLPIQAVTTRSDTSGMVKEVSTEETESDQDEIKIDEEIVEYVFMFVEEEGIAKMQKVKTGIQNNAFIQILEGLKEGDEIIVAPYRAVSKKLKNGDEVKKVPKEDLFTSSE